MIEYVLLATGRMAGQTGVIVVKISGDAFVLVVRFRIGVAVRATEFLDVVWIGMTIAALHPFPLVFSTVDREKHSIVVECRRHPCIFRMAGRTVRGKLKRLVRRIDGLVIIFDMATGTGVGRIAVIAFVARGTIQTNMRS